MSTIKLGVSDGRLAPLPGSPNAVSSQTSQRGKQVDELAMQGDIAATKLRIAECLRKMGGNKIVSERENYIHAVFTSRFFRFKDDVEFYIEPRNGKVQFRSASRVGYSDLGANRKRYQSFRKLYLK